MQPIAIILILISVFMHATWNLIGKRRSPTTAFFLVSNCVGVLCFSPVLFIYWDQFLLIPKEVWLLIGITGIFQGIYFAGLANAYQRGDMSVAYPLARSTSVVFVVLAVFLLGRGGQISTLCIIGMVLVVVGCFTLPMKRFSDLRLKNYLNLFCLFALITAIASAGYSVVDDESLRRLRDIHLTARDSALIYIVLEATSTSLCLALLVVFRKAGRQDIRDVLRDGKRAAALTGIIVFITYTLVLISMAYVDDISYVVAFRQLSIPIGALMGVFILREARTVPKLLGVIMVLTGAVLVAMG